MPDPNSIRIVPNSPWLECLTGKPLAKTRQLGKSKTGISTTVRSFISALNSNLFDYFLKFSILASPLKVGILGAILLGS